MFILTVIINDTAYSYGPFKTLKETETWAAKNLNGQGSNAYISRLYGPTPTINQIAS